MSTEDDEDELTEMWLVPGDANEVEKIYGAMTQCQVMHPDPNDSFSEDEDGTQKNIKTKHLLIEITINPKLYIQTLWKPLKKAMPKTERNKCRT